MRIARIELRNGKVTWALQQRDERLVRAEGDPFTGLTATDEVVEPRRWLPPAGCLRIPR